VTGRNLDEDDPDAIGSSMCISIRSQGSATDSRGPRRVDQGREMLRPDRGHRLVDRGGMAGEVLGPERLQVGKAEHPLAVGLAVEGDHRGDVGA
jgi:hypothetical protein